MITDQEELKRIRAKLASFPPYDWEDDVEELLGTVEEGMRWREALSSELRQAQRVAQKYAADRDLFHDALTRIRVVIGSEDMNKFDQILSLIRAAEVKSWGER